MLSFPDGFQTYSPGLNLYLSPKKMKRSLADFSEIACH